MWASIWAAGLEGARAGGRQQLGVGRPVGEEVGQRRGLLERGQGHGAGRARLAQLGTIEGAGGGEEVHHQLARVAARASCPWLLGKKVARPSTSSLAELAAEARGPEGGDEAAHAARVGRRLPEARGQLAGIGGRLSGQPARPSRAAGPRAAPSWPGRPAALEKPSCRASVPASPSPNRWRRAAARAPCARTGPGSAPNPAGPGPQPVGPAVPPVPAPIPPPMPPAPLPPAAGSTPAPPCPSGGCVWFGPGSNRAGTRARRQDQREQRPAEVAGARGDAGFFKHGCSPRVGCGVKLRVDWSWLRPA